jgi:hypothetical protein
LLIVSFRGVDGRACVQNNGPMSNTGFVDAITKHAGAGSVGVPELGTFAPLAGPTIAPDGTVLLGTREGKVIALHADGTPFWNRQLPTGQTITSSPAVGSDGAAYVVGSSIIRDHRGGQSVTTGRGVLYRFTPGGGAPPSAVTEFPRHERGPTTIGPPNIWRFGSDEAIIVPALYPTVGGYDLHLLAFSPEGGLIADWQEYLSGGDVTSAGSWEALAERLGLGGFEHGMLGPPAAPPFPGVAIAASPQGGTPSIVLVDRYFQKTIAFTFCIGPSCSPAPGFTERFRTPHAPRVLLSPATILPDMHSVVGTKNGVVFSGSNFSAAVDGLDAVYATPTIAGDGRVILVNVIGETIALQGTTIVSRLRLQGETIARAAASRNHVFLATTDAFYTLDAHAAAVEFRFPWVGGGAWSPAIGPQGHVYAMASNVLFVFPPPPRVPRMPHDLDVLGGSPAIGSG